MLLALGACLCLGWLAAPPAGTPAHTKDGADVDLSLVVESRGARLLVRANGVAVRDWLGLPAHSPAGLEAEWAAELGQLAFEALGAEPMRLDAARVQAADATRLSYFPVHGALAASVLELEFWIPRSPLVGELDFGWEYFPEDGGVLGAGRVPLVVLAGAERARFELSASEPAIHWVIPAETAPQLLQVEPAPKPRAPLGPAPIAGLVLLAGGWTFLRLRQGRRGSAAMGAGCALLVGLLAARSRAPKLEPEQAREIFERLHTNVYRAFDSVDRSQVYDALASSAAGPLLDQIYGSVSRSLEVADHGGARGWVEGLDVLAAECTQPSLDAQGRMGFQVRARWRVRARLEHSDHAHQRAEEYAALYSVAATEAGWRLVDLEILSQKRVPTPKLPREE